MISFVPFAQTRRRTGISSYQLITRYGISSSTINRIRHNLPISTVTLNDLCAIYHCRVEDIIVYIPDSASEQKSFYFIPWSVCFVLLLITEGAVAQYKVWQPLNLPACRRALFAKSAESLENAWFYQKTKRSAPVRVRNVMVKYQYANPKHFTPKLQFVFKAVSTETSARDRTYHSG